MLVVVVLVVLDVRLGPVTMLLASTSVCANWAAICAARLESIGVRTVPVSTIALPAISLCTFEPGMRRVKSVVERRQVGADGNLEREDLLPVLVEEEGVGLTGFLGDQEHPVGGLHDGVEHGRVGNEDVLQRHGKLHHDRAADAQVEPLRQRECRVGRNAQHGIAANLATGSGLTFHVSRADVADASRDKKHCSHTGASPS